jgi:hypothetical protein
LSGAHVGTGFTDRALCDLRLRLDDLARPLPENVDARRLVESTIAAADERHKTTRNVVPAENLIHAGDRGSTETHPRMQS